MGMVPIFSQMETYTRGNSVRARRMAGGNTRGKTGLCMLENSIMV